MAEDILNFLGSFIIEVINRSGHIGVFMLMAIESANIPLPSEITMPFAGFLAQQGRFNFWIIGIVGAVGNLAGSILIYWLVLKGGRPFVARYGKYFFMRSEEVALAERWFLKHGAKAVFFGRLLPVIRTFISTPAGLFKMPFGSFTLLTFAGSLPWSLFLTWIGFKLGSEWSKIHGYFSEFSNAILIGLIILITWWVLRHFHYRNKKINETI